MSTPTLDRTKPFAEIHDATGSVILEQNGHHFNLGGDYMPPAGAEAHTPQPIPPVPEPDTVPPPEREEGEEEEDQRGTENHENHRGHKGKHHRGMANK